jgi:hypothetical protein
MSLVVDRLPTPTLWLARLVHTAAGVLVTRPTTACGRSSKY